MVMEQIKNFEDKHHLQEVVFTWGTTGKKEHKGMVVKRRDGLFYLLTDLINYNYNFSSIIGEKYKYQYEIWEGNTTYPGKIYIKNSIKVIEVW